MACNYSSCAIGFAVGAVFPLVPNRYRDTDGYIATRSGDLTVESIDIAGTIQLFEKSSVDEIPGISGFCRGNLLGQFGENHLEAIESRVGLSRHEAAQDLIGIVEIPFLLQAHVFAKRALGDLRIDGRELNSFDERFHDPARDVR